MKLKAIAIIVAALALLSGCAAQSVDEVKKKPSATHVFTMPVNYQEVYRNIVQTARVCWTSSMMSPAQFVVDTDLYSDLGKGEMTIWMSYLGPSIYLHSVMQRKGDALTEVTVYTFYSTWNSMGPRVERWANGSKEC